MRGVLRWGFLGLVIVHGLIHLIGAAKGLGWAHIGQLDEPTTAAGGILWLAAAGLVLAAAVMVAGRRRGWWLLVTGAAVVSQTAIVTSWSDAMAGTVVNVVMLFAAVYGYRAEGPRSLRAEYRREVQQAQAEPHETGVVTEDDLARLPEPVATYVRRSGAVGEPRVTSFEATVHGRIRGGPDKPWMPFTGRQVNTFGPDPKRLFFMDATMFGLPVDILHVFNHGTASMRGRLCSLIPILDASGTEMTRAETVTFFNDLCIMAPAALADAPVTWTAVDAHSTRGTFTLGGQSVEAVLRFNEDGDLVDFVSEDRLRASTDGRRFTRLEWSTPVGHYADVHARRVATQGEAIWAAPEPEGRFSYLEFGIDDITYDVGTPSTTGGADRPLHNTPTRRRTR